VNPLAADLDHVLAHTTGLWEELRGCRIFIAGGTGFFGRWLLESFAWANDRLALNAESVVLTRRPESFAAKAPQLANHRAIRLHAGDVLNFTPPAGRFDFVIHAATDTTGHGDEIRLLDTIVTGTRRVLEFAAASGVRKLLLTSSGAVYGRQPPELTHVPEEYAGGPDPCNSRSAYGEGKRIAELLCVLHSREGLECKIARCFAFVGPHLPLDAHFAVGNFLRDALSGGPIHVNGDGSPYRSYLYAADLAVWLWTILFRGVAGRPYNAGSDEAMSIEEIAHAVAEQFSPPPEVLVAKPRSPGVPAERYVPSIRRAVAELRLAVRVPFVDAVRRTAQFAAPSRPFVPDLNHPLHQELSHP
jgi:nucleoside-diphosphate-sugar epimerase